MLLSDKTIASLCKPGYKYTLSGFNLTRICTKPMIEPFIPEQIKNHEIDGKFRRIPSFGLSSYGYDVRLQPKFKLFKSGVPGQLDIFNFDEDESLIPIDADKVVIPPGGLLLGVTMEKFNMPSDITGVCVGKSTWARIGAQVLVTPLEAGWSGELVIEITNGTNMPLVIYAGVGIAQIQFFKGDQVCLTNYKSRNGKYDNQVGVTASKL